MKVGFISRLIPDLNRIVTMMQFLMYYHCTMDKHLLCCIGMLSEGEHNDGEKIHSLSH